MNTLVKNAEIAVKLHPAITIKTMLGIKPCDASLVAVNQYKSALIFYKTDGKHFYADYGNGRGWEKVRHKTQDGLASDLAACAFVLCDVAALEAALPVSMGAEVVNPMQVLKARIDAQFTRVDGRREHEKDKAGYWQGQYDAYEIVQHMVREFI